ncbi:hypothetical protein KUTeg_022834 [Tegillarca granosa]|uniref:Uncharacterized protein n=1 Tax=Tegillarca granosa TaxID=220873 RepID=A0ABQ9DZV0_TEGGR|nr:hypothetical protein KUTeg_022803 [Tegillarca granosa]KAJ8298774.1 hypothetical protein KUTeg_022834 [Tegillarca granosa]
MSCNQWSTKDYNMRLLLVCSIFTLGLCHTAAPDHLLQRLEAIHKSHVYTHLHSQEKVIIVELIAAAEVDQITHYIDSIGMAYKQN